MQDDVRMTCRHYFTLPWDSRASDGSVWPEGGGIVLKLASDEYLVAGSGIVIEFEKVTEQNVAKTLGEDGFVQAGSGQKERAETIQRWSGRRIGIGSVDEVNVNEDGTFRFVRRLNGDQNHQGRHVRIPVGTFSILRVQLYEYE